MNAPVTVLKAPQPESVANSLVSEELARFVGAFATVGNPRCGDRTRQALDSRCGRHRARLDRL